MGKNTQLGKFLDRNGLDQVDLEKEAKLSGPTVSKACNDNDYISGPTVAKKILVAVKKIKPNAKSTDFWDM